MVTDLGYCFRNSKLSLNSFEITANLSSAISDICSKLSEVNGLPLSLFPVASFVIFVNLRVNYRLIIIYMDKLSKKEWVAVGVSVAFVAYVMFGGTITSFFMTGLGGNQAAIGSVGGDYSDNLNGMGNEINEGGVATEDVVLGTGEVIQQGQAVSVHYVLSLTDGTIIQDSKLVSGGQPFTFVYGAGQLIPGWEIGIKGMRIGSK